MTTVKKATGKEDYHTYKDGFGTLTEPSKMVTKSIQISSFGSNTTRPNSTELTTAINNQSCLIHTIDIINVSADDDVYFEIYDHAWGRYGNDGIVRYNCSDGQSDESQCLAKTSAVGRADIVGNGALDATFSSVNISVGDLVSIENDGDEGTADGLTPKNQYIESVVADTTGQNPYVRRGMGGTPLGDFWDNTLFVGGRNRFKGLVPQPAKSNSHVRYNFPIPLLVEGGWRVRSHDGAGSSTSALIMNITYSVLEHVATRDQSALGGGSDYVGGAQNYVGPSHNYIGEIEDANYRFLKCAWNGGDTASTFNQDHWLVTDVEVYGGICTSLSSSSYRGYKIKDGTGSAGAGDTKLEIWDYGFSHSSDPILTNHGPVVEPQWYPYPVFLKKGIRVQNKVGNSQNSGDASNAYLSVLYRPVKSNNTGANDSMV